MSTRRKLIFALPANLFAGLLLLLADCLATSCQAGSQSTEERSNVYLIYDGDSLLNLNGSPWRTRWLTGGTSLSFALPLLNRSVHAVKHLYPANRLGRWFKGLPTTWEANTTANIASLSYTVSVGQMTFVPARPLLRSTLTCRRT